MAASPADEFTAPPAKRSPDLADAAPPRLRPGGGKTGAAERIVAVKPALALLCRIALGAVWLSCAAGCSDRPLVLVGPSSSTLRIGLVGLWHFDEVNGSTVTDSSGNENHGKLSRATDPSAAWVPGKFGNALAVEAGGYAVVQSSTTIDGIASGVTVSAWVSYEGTINDNDPYGTAISRQIGTGVDQYYHLSLRRTEGYPNLWIAPTLPSPTNVTVGKAVPHNAWVHLAGTYDEMTGATLYVNGEIVSTGSIMGRFPGDVTPVILGGNGNGSGVSEVFPGRIDEIALYSRPLSQPEIMQLAQGPVL